MSLEKKMHCFVNLNISTTKFIKVQINDVMAQISRSMLALNMSQGLLCPNKIWNASS
jgi:hypothetical protein